MDTAADPRQDFRRYAGGRWLDAAKIPGDQLEISGYLVMQETVQTQLRDLLQEAARTSGAAPRGSPAQQVGDFYASGMDVARLKSLGVQPLAPEFDRIAKVQGPTALAEEIARLQTITGSSVLLGAVVAPHPRDRTRMTIYIGDASLGLGVDNYLRPDAQRFAAATAKQADAFEIMPGLHLNGALEVTETLTDVGGVALGYAALQEHLREHPAANRTIDGFTPSQHEMGLYEAFGIRAGDRMWLDPIDRVAIW
jgi:predicted metalloendopeptidase